MDKKENMINVLMSVADIEWLVFYLDANQPFLNETEEKAIHVRDLLKKRLYHITLEENVKAGHSLYCKINRELMCDCWLD